jgi:hypothetical protein
VPFSSVQLHSQELRRILAKQEVRTKKCVRKMRMPKRYTLTSAAADVEAALRLLEGRWELVILFHLFGGKVMRFSDLERARYDRHEWPQGFRCHPVFFFVKSVAKCGL